MIEPTTLNALLATNRVDEVKAAIVARLRALLPDVAVRSHPGKLDISDVVTEDIVKTPGIAIGWSRIRTVEDIASGFGLQIDWTAYVVVEDRADNAAKRRFERESVGHAIGGFLIRVLGDEDEAAWGLMNIGLPSAPEFKPLFTSRSFAKGIAYYAVTWSQELIETGEPPFPGLAPTVSETEDEQVLFEDGDIPAEIRALVENAGIEEMDP
jgi:hypothetical protein